MSRKDRLAKASKERKLKKVASALPDNHPHVVPFNPNILQVYGPIINARIGISGAQAQALQTAKAVAPASPVSCKLLVDTGCTTTLIRHDIAEKAGLPVIKDNHPVHGVGVDTTGKLYFGRVTLPFQIRTPRGDIVQEVTIDTQIAGGKLSNITHLDGLLGRDVLRHFELIYNGQTGTLTFRYLSGISKKAARR